MNKNKNFETENIQKKLGEKCLKAAKGEKYGTKA